MREPFTYTPEHLNQSIVSFGHRWYWFRKLDFIIMVPPKSGATAIRQYIWMNELQREDVAGLKHYQVHRKAYVVIRDPLARFASLWKNKCRDKTKIKDGRVYGMTPHELMNHIETGNADVHWTPQVRLVGDKEVTYIPSEKLNEWWSSNGYGELGKYNTTEGDVDLDDSLKERILTFYADDVKLYEQTKYDYKLNPEL